MVNSVIRTVRKAQFLDEEGLLSACIVLCLRQAVATTDCVEQKKKIILFYFLRTWPVGLRQELLLQKLD